MSNDAELLRQYVEECSESAFTEVVHAHLNLVYSSALRETSGDRALAEDVSQAVFTELARKASRLLGHPSLAGWLYTTVRHRAANLRRAERHRRSREEDAQSMNELLSEGSPNEAWERVRPILDDALHELKEEDREVVVLRFLEGQTFREVGARLGLKEDAVRMRVGRALEKLRGLLARRGIASTASGLAGALAIAVVTPAPAALAATIASTALASGAATGSTSLTLVKLMSITQVKVGLIGALLVAAFAMPVWQQTRLQRERSENARLRAQQTEFATLRGEAARLHPDEADRAELERLREWKAQIQPELLRLRGMAGVARRANAEAEELKAQLARQTSGAGTQASGSMGDLMNQSIKQAMEQQVEGRLSRMTASLHLTPEQAQAARDILMRQAQAMSAGMQQATSGQYNKEELASLGKAAGNTEGQIKALLTPDQLAAYPSYQQEEGAHNARLAANQELLQMESTLGLTADQEDRAFAALYGVTLNQLTASPTPVFASPVDEL